MRLTRRYGFFFIPLFIAVIGFIAAWPSLEHAEWFMEFCGVERWSVKTGTDADAGSVNLNAPQPNTIATMVGWPAQANPPANNRISPYETTVWVVNATLVEYKAETDEDYHLVLKDSSGNTMIAEIPAPHCVSSSSPFLAGITSARSKFDAKYTATGSFQTANIPVQVTGIGMFDFPHGQTGAAPNQIELHPVIDIVFNPGSGNPPAVPTGLTATAGNAQIALAWTASSGATSYNLYRSNSTGTETSYKTGLTATSYTDTGLTNGTTYFYKVTAVNSAGESAKSNEASATPTSSSPPPAPTNLTAAAGNTQIALSWTASAGATSYTLYRSNASGTETSYKTGLTATSYTDTALTNGTVYYYQVTALNANGESARSNEANAAPSNGGATMTVQLLGNPGFENGASNPAPWVVGTTRINSSSSEPPHSGTWDAWLDGYGSSHTDTLYQQVMIPANANSATLSFWLHIDSAETTTTTAYDTLNVQIRNTSGTVLTTLATYSNLNKATGYTQKSFDISSYKGQTIQIALVGTEGSIKQTSFVVDDFALNAVVPVPPPAIPANLTATVGNGQVALAWTASSGATSYTLYRSTLSGEEGSYQTGLTTTSYTDTGVTNGVTYYYEVTAVNAGGESGASNEASATPAGPGIVSGRVALEGIPDLSATNAAAPPGTLQILFRMPGTLTTLYTSNVTLTPVGAGSPFATYTSSAVPAGTYDIALKTSKNLRVVLTNVTIFGPTTLADVTLPAGDANNDNMVDVSDFSILVNAYNGIASDPTSGYDPNADLNADGSVDVVDFSLLVNRYSALGDP